MIDEKPLFWPRMLDARIRQAGNDWRSSVIRGHASRCFYPRRLMAWSQRSTRSLPERRDRWRAHRHGRSRPTNHEAPGQAICLAPRRSSWRVALSCSLICLSFARIRLRDGVLPSTKYAAASSEVAAIVREPKELERLRLAETFGRGGSQLLFLPNSMSLVFSGWRLKPEIGHARMEEAFEKPFRVVLALEADCNRVRPHSARQSCRPSIDVAAIDEPRGRRRSAGRAFASSGEILPLRLSPPPSRSFGPPQAPLPPTICGSAGQSRPIADPMLNEPDQPCMADRVEERPDIHVEGPIDPPLPQPVRERVQRIVLSALRPEPVAEPQELRLVDRRQDRRHRRLDNLVLQRPAMPSGRRRPSAFGIYRRREASASRYPPPMHTCVKVLESLPPGLSSYCVHVSPSTPGAAVFFSPKHPARKTSTLT